MKEKLHQKAIRDKEFADYEKKYLEEMGKSQTQHKNTNFPNPTTKITNKTIVQNI